MPNRLYANTIQGWDSITSPNFPLLFVERWIPFNAWYYQTTSMNNDRECLNSFKSNSNNILYDRIWALLQKDSKNYENVCFQHEFIALDACLEATPFPSNANRLLFGMTEMLPNTENEKSERANGFGYKVKRYTDSVTKPKGTVESIVENLKQPQGGLVSFDINRYDLQEYQNKLTQQKLSREKRSHLKSLFLQVEPIIHIDIKDTKNGVIIINKKRFANNRDAICAAIISILYELRCKAVHGEVAVTETIFPIYEHAYKMLELITKKLY